MGTATVETTRPLTREERLIDLFEGMPTFELERIISNAQSDGVLRFLKREWQRCLNGGIYSPFVFAERPDYIPTNQETRIVQNILAERYSNRD